MGIVHPLLAGILGVEPGMMPIKDEKKIENIFTCHIRKVSKSDLVDWVSEGTLSLVRGSSLIKVVGKVGIVSVRSILCSRTSVFLYYKGFYYH